MSAEWMNHWFPHLPRRSCAMLSCGLKKVFSCSSPLSRNATSTPIKSEISCLSSFLTQRQRTHALLKHAEPRLPRRRTYLSTLTRRRRLRSLFRRRLRSLAVLRRRWQLDVHDAHNGRAFQHTSDLLCIQSWRARRRARACTCTWAGVGRRGGEEPEKACQNALPRRCTSVCEAIKASAACCGDGDDVVDAEGDMGYMDVREDSMT